MKKINIRVPTIWLIQVNDTVNTNPKYMYCGVSDGVILLVLVIQNDLVHEVFSIMRYYNENMSHMPIG